MLKDKLRKIRGFALVEFIVVMIVIAVLIALALPYYNGMTAKASETKLRNDARVVQDACDYFYGHNGEYPYLLDSEGNKIIAANNNGYFDIIYKVVDFDPTNTDVHFYEIDFDKLRSYLNVDSNQGYFLAAHGNPDFGVVVLNPVSQVTQDRIEKIKSVGVVNKEKPVIQMDYLDSTLTTNTTITWSYTYAYDILEEEWEGKQESYPEEGEYTVRLRVKNPNGVWSDWADISFYVIQYGFSLSNESPGTVITFSGKEWYVLEQLSNGQTYILMCDLDSEKQFDPDGTQIFDPTDSNNIAYYLNNTFYDGLSQKDLVESHTWDTSPVNGNGGKEGSESVACKVGLISYHEYKAYGEYFNGDILPDSYDVRWWTLSPRADIPSNVWRVNTGGILFNVNASGTCGVRPALYLKSGLLVDENKVVLEES